MKLVLLDSLQFLKRFKVFKVLLNLPDCCASGQEGSDGRMD